MEYKECKNCNQKYGKGKYVSRKRWETSAYCSVKCSASHYYKITENPKRGFPKGHQLKSRLGAELSDITREKMREASVGKAKPWLKGENHPNWKGGITPIHISIRNSIEYRAWRVKVLQRDRYTCVECGLKSKGNGDIHVDHIKQFAYYPKERYNLANGRVLCIPCHQKTLSYKARHKI